MTGRFAVASGAALVLLALGLGAAGCSRSGRPPRAVVPAPPGSVPEDMVTFDEFTFRMGSPPGEGFGDERPQRVVTLSPFAMDRTEVTVGAYRRCVEAGVCSPPAREAGCTDEAGPDDLPVTCVDWHQAGRYCAWRGARLPTEAEWEGAAAGPRHRTFPWGSEPPRCDRAVFKEIRGDGSEAAPGCGLGGPDRVCSRPLGTTPEGMCDMAGNVLEWVSDWYRRDAYQTGEGRDPQGPSGGQPGRLRRSLTDPNRQTGARRRIDRTVEFQSPGERVRRGGSFADVARLLRTSKRFSGRMSDRSPTTGFRCARSLVPGKGARPAGPGR